jgi:hypothetical protein
MHTLCYKDFFLCIWNKTLFLCGLLSNKWNKTFTAPPTDMDYLCLLVSLHFPFETTQINIETIRSLIRTLKDRLISIHLTGKGKEN